MTGKFLLGVLVGTIAIFIWAALWWMVLPFAADAMKPMPNGEAVAQTVAQAVNESGTYFYPAISKDASQAEIDACMEKHKAGPLLMVTVSKTGTDMMSGSMFAMGLLHYFISVLLVALLMRMTFPKLQSYGSRVGFITIAGLFAAFFVDFSYPIWFHTPMSFYLTEFFHHASGWLVAGLAMAAMIKPTGDRTAA